MDNLGNEENFKGFKSEKDAFKSELGYTELMFNQIYFYKCLRLTTKKHKPDNLYRFSLNHL